MNNQAFTRSIFNNVCICGNFCYIHFPLIFKIGTTLCPQSYADAVIHFLKLIRLDKKVYNEIVDDTVVELLRSDISTIHNTAIEKFEDYNFFIKQKSRLDFIYKTLPTYFESMENAIKYNKQILFSDFKKAYKMLVELLSVSNFSFIVETYLADFLKDNKKSKEYLDFVAENTFSHVKYFNDENKAFENSKDEEFIKSFCWNVGFLKTEIGEITEFEDAKFLLKLLNKNLAKSDIIPQKFDYPNIPSFEIDSDMPLIILWMKLLQTNLEYRHYWQFRLFRDIRFYYNYDKNITTNWTLKDYEKNDFKIK